MKELIRKFRIREINTEQVLEDLAQQGFCPNLLNDDNGHWALAFDRFQSIAESEDPCDIDTAFSVYAEYWKDSIYEAILYSIKDLE